MVKCDIMQKKFSIQRFLYMKKKINSDHNAKKKKFFMDGLKDGIPIALGYLSVSFGFGISAANLKIPTLASVIMSITNLTSAGQIAGINIIAAGGSLAEMALTQLVINLRYALMGLSLSQKMDQTFALKHRMLISYGITDEVFDLAVAQPGYLTPNYMYGLILLPLLGWTAGTFLGAISGNLLPIAVNAALSLAIYGMFTAIVLPAAKQERGVLWCSLMAAALSCVITYVPWFAGITQGFSVIICAIVAAAAMALLFPKSEVSEE